MFTALKLSKNPWEKKRKENEESNSTKSKLPKWQKKHKEKYSTSGISTRCQLK